MGNCTGLHPLATPTTEMVEPYTYKLLSMSMAGLCQTRANVS